MRRTSVSLPTKHIAHDPHEKPDRYDNGNRDASLIMKMQSAWASQSQRARYIKTGAIIFVVFFLFYCFSPSGVDIYHGGRLRQEGWEGARFVLLLTAFSRLIRGSGPNTVRFVVQRRKMHEILF